MKTALYNTKLGGEGGGRLYSTTEHKEYFVLPSMTTKQLGIICIYAKLLSLTMKKDLEKMAIKIYVELLCV